jgi:enoyl-CoA hydratase/carnithine racemase
MADRRNVEFEQRGEITVVRTLPVEDLDVVDALALDELWDALYEFRRERRKVLVLDLAEGHLAPQSVDKLWAKAEATLEKSPQAGTRHRPVPILARAQKNLRELLEYLHGLEAPSLVALRGDVDLDLMGFALACSHRTCCEDTVFHNRILDTPGVPGSALVWYLTRSLGRSRAQSLLLESGTITANDALELGLVDAVTARGGTSEYVMSLARRLAEKSQDALASACRAFTEAERDFATYLQVIGVGFDPAPRD